jgi:hypothetical protein
MQSKENSEAWVMGKLDRDENRERDESFKLALRSFSKFHIKIRVWLEGGKVTTLTWFRVALKKTFCRYSISP